jgi:hypothetical protein
VRDIFAACVFREFVVNPTVLKGMACSNFLQFVPELANDSRKGRIIENKPEV